MSKNTGMVYEGEQLLKANGSLTNWPSTRSSKDRAMSKNTGMVYEGEQLLKHWWSAKAEARRLRERADVAEAEARNAEKELSKWILPAECKPGEQIAIWFGDSLIQAVAEEPVGPKWSGPVTVRLQGPRFSELIVGP